MSNKNLLLLLFGFNKKVLFTRLSFNCFVYWFLINKNFLLISFHIFITFFTQINLDPATIFLVTAGVVVLLFFWFNLSQFMESVRLWSKIKIHSSKLNFGGTGVVSICDMRKTIRSYFHFKMKIQMVC